MKNPIYTGHGGQLVTTPSLEAKKPIKVTTEIPQHIKDYLGLK